MDVQDLARRGGCLDQGLAAEEEEADAAGAGCWKQMGVEPRGKEKRQEEEGCRG